MRIRTRGDPRFQRRSSATIPPVASLEDHAIQRDKRFLIRLVLLLSLGLIFGLFVFDHLTGSSVATCAARSMGG